MLLDAIEVIATLGAAGYAAHRIENAWLAYRNNQLGVQGKFAFKKPPNLAGEIERLALQADSEERQKLLASPTGWLLDPFRYPTDPHVGRKIPAAHGGIDAALESIARINRVHNGLEAMYVGPAMLNPVQTYRMTMTPRCPNCGEHDGVEASSTHRGEVSMWWCHKCDAEFTRDGETKKSIKRRKSLLSVLPCGCIGEIEVDFILNGVRESTCRTCFSTWEPRSNDKTGRTLGQGDRVRWSASKRRAGFGEHDLPFDMPPPPSMR